MQCYITITSQDGTSTLFGALTSEAQKCDKWHRNVSVNTIEINKELYTPNTVQVQLQLAKILGGAPLSMKTIKDDLMEAQLSVWSSPTGLTDERYRTYIVREYQIHKVQPVMGREVCINFTAYSPDVRLTYDKYCATWVSKHLAKDIVPTVLKNSFFAGAKLDARLNTNNLRQLKYDGGKKELIQPYLVQYNESFYDFLRRVAYRCGEYLYWEDNKLHLGLNRPLEIIKDIRFSECVADYSFQSENSVSAIHRDIFDENIVDEEKKKIIFPKGWLYADYISSQDYFDKVYEYSKNKDFVKVWNPKAQITRYVSTTLKKPTYVDMVANVASSIFKDMTKAGIKNDKNKDKFNSSWCFDDDGASTRSKKADQFSMEDGYQIYTVFSSVDSGGAGNLDANFYQNMQKGSQQITDTRMTITLNTSSYQHVGLGDIIQLQGNKVDKYIVTRVYRKEINDDIIYYIDVVTYDENNLYPPVPREENSFPLIREAGPQTAFVTGGGDPLGLGRIRVKYPWQNKDEDPTPYIRMSAQMASKNSGFFFEPATNDEVLINFVGGNVEQPYVAGCLYSGNNKPTEYSTNAITSRNGHSISFSDPTTGTGWMFLNEFLPIASIIQSNIEDTQKDDLKELKKKTEEKKNAVTSSGVSDNPSNLDTSTSEGLANVLSLQTKLNLARNFYAAALCKPTGFFQVVPASIYKPIQFDRQKEAELKRVPKSVYTPVPESVYTPVPESVISPIPEDVYTSVPEGAYEPMPEDYPLPIPLGVDKEEWKAEKRREWNTLKAKEWQDNQKEAWVQQQIDAWKPKKAKEWQEQQKKEYVNTKFDTDLSTCAGTTKLDKLATYIKTKKDAIANETDEAKKAALTEDLQPYEQFYYDACTTQVSWDDVDKDKKISTADYIKNAQFYMHRREITQRLSKKNASGEFLPVVDSDWNLMENNEWTDTSKAIIESSSTSVNNMDYMESTDIVAVNTAIAVDALLKQDMANDERWYIPQVDAYKEVTVKDKEGKDVKVKYTNLLDRLAAKIHALNEKIKDIQLPDDPSNCPDGPYKDYLNAKKEQDDLDKELKNSPTVGKGDDHHAGGITMADSLGMYKISMDAGKRNISISSPLGDVKIDAFSGISIEAPTGDVSIKGKNITLEAGNNIKIISGKNKYGKTKDIGKSVAKALLNTAIDVAETAMDEGLHIKGGIVDLKTLRLVYECIITPVEGTLQIHSGNNLILESNDAKAHLPLADINSKSNRNEVAKSRLKSLNAAVDMVANQEKYITSIIAPLKDATDSFAKLLSRKIPTGTDTKTIAKHLFGKDAVTDVIQDYFGEITDGKEIKKAQAFAETDYEYTKHGFAAGYEPSTQEQTSVKMITAEAENMRKVIKGYIESANNFSDTLKDNFKTIGVDDIATKIAALYPLKEDLTDVIIRCEDGKLLPNETISGLWNAKKEFTNYGSDDARHEALKAIASTLTDGGYSENKAKAAFEGVWKDVNSWFGKDIKPVAQYVNATNSLESFTMAISKIENDTNATDWSNFIDNFVEPDLGTAVTIIKDALSKLLGDLTGLDKVGKDVAAIIDDTQSIGAQRTGKFLISTKGDTTVEVGENGTISEVPTGSASLKSLKKKLQKSW